jgi:hypothetical protein
LPSFTEAVDSHDYLIIPLSCFRLSLGITAPRFVNYLTPVATTDSSLIPPILHYSAPEPYTKFEICLVFSKLLGVPITHITPDADEPTGPAAVSRPKDCQLYTRETEDMMEGAGGLSTTGFEEWWAEYLGGDKGQSSTPA